MHATRLRSRRDAGRRRCAACGRRPRTRASTASRRRTSPSSPPARRCLRAHVPAGSRARSGKPRSEARQVGGRIASGPSGSRSQRGAWRRMPGEASGRMSENASAPALPRLACAATPSRSISSTSWPSGCRRNAIETPTMPAPITSTSHASRWTARPPAGHGQRRDADRPHHRGVRPSPTRTRPRDRRSRWHRASRARGRGSTAARRSRARATALRQDACNVPVKTLPITLSWRHGAPGASLPSAARQASFALVPVPHGERS